MSHFGNLFKFTHALKTDCDVPRDILIVLNNIYADSCI